MKRFFNIAGPCRPAEHYLLPTLARLPEVNRLVAERQYFVIHAARQSGKTTLLQALAAELNGGTERAALYCSLESVQGLTEPERGIPAALRALKDALRWQPWAKQLAMPTPDLTSINTGLKAYLADLCAALERPLVVLFDEADCLAEQTLITFLRQLREGFVNRGTMPFPSSVALVGMRNIRDYRAQVRPERETLGSASPFNIIAAALTLKNFTRDELATLYGQHTADTGQVFEAAAVDRAAYWSGGQPWLVNALARECVDVLLERDFARPVTAAHVDQAAENLLERRDTHLDSLYERLKEDRVRRVVEPVIVGREGGLDPLDDDCRYVLDLGLLTLAGGTLKPANPIYAEVILRTLSVGDQLALQTKVATPPWATAAGLDMSGLLRAFQEFWRENSEVWVERYEYREAAPHLILMAFLQRVLNGGGQLVREYSLGRRRVDLCAVYAGRRYPVELKLWDGPKTRDEGLAQLAAYCDECGAREGWLVLFDRRPGRSWDERIFWETTPTAGGRTLHLVGC